MPREKENYKYLGILEADIIKHAEMKETRKKSLRQTRKLLETKLWGWNLIKRIKICVVPLYDTGDHFEKE